MAKQSGILPIEGTLGTITFFKSKDGYLARQKGGVSAKRIANDPAFKRTRENGAEFGRAGKAGKLLRTAIAGIAKKARDNRAISRLTGRMLKAIQADTINMRGSRTVNDGDPTLLSGFDFNIAGSISSIFLAPYTIITDRVAGSVTINIPSFVPTQMLVLAGGCTHFRIISSVAAIDFNTSEFESDMKETAVLPATNQATAALSLVHSFTPGSTFPLFILLGVEFMQGMNGEQYALHSTSNCLAIVKVEV